MGSELQGINVYEALSDLDLEPENSLLISLSFAQAIHNERVEQVGYKAPGLTRTSILLGAFYADIEVKEALMSAGLMVQELLADIKLKGYSPSPDESSFDVQHDFYIHENVKMAISLYAEAFGKNRRIDAKGIAWGLLGAGEGLFLERLSKAGCNINAASEILYNRISGYPGSKDFSEEQQVYKEAQEFKEGFEYTTAIDKTTTPSIQPKAPPQPRLHGDRWSSIDKLGYDLYAESIAEFIRNEDTHPPIVIGIQAPWGQGKTTLMRMIQKKLDPDHPELRDKGFRTNKSAPSGKETQSTQTPGREQPQITFEQLLDAKKKTPDVKAPKEKQHRTVWFNAWKHQNSEQIWAGLAHCILAQLTERLRTVDRQRFWLQLQLRRVQWDEVVETVRMKALAYLVPNAIRLFLWLLGSLGIFIISLFVPETKSHADLIPVGFSVLSGGGVLAILWNGWKKWNTSKTKALGEKLEGEFLEYIQQPDYKGRLGFLHLVEEDLKRVLDLLTDEQYPAIIFVDDLDRCSPKNVAEIIEAINLFLAGDFPHCVFVLGMDAQVIAASMEVAHENIVRKLGDSGDQLGWRFMDKFIQLPFVIPRLTPKQSDKFLKSMFGISDENSKSKEEVHAKNSITDILNRLNSKELDPEKAAHEIGKIGEVILAAAPDEAQHIQRRVIEAGGERYRDDDPMLVKLFDPVRPFMTDNPRTIKRLVNLFRFQYFASMARRMQNVPAAEPQQLARWAIMLVRWPHFVRWIQAERARAMQRNEDMDPAEPSLVVKVIIAARDSKDLTQWSNALKKLGLSDPRWIKDFDLMLFLQNNPDIDQAGRYGIW